MKFNIRTIFLKSLPYLMSIAGGIVLYTGAIDNAPNANIRDLVINVSASLLSIPLVFLLYDYTNSKVANQMKKNISNSITDRINLVMVNLILTLRDSMGVRSKLTPENLNRMLAWRASDVSQRLHITPSVLQRIHDCHTDLDTVLYRNGQHDVLSADTFQILSSIARDMAHIINEHKFHHNNHTVAKYVAGMMSHILDWLDSDSIAALNLQQHLISDEKNNPTGTFDKKKNKKN